MAVQSIGAASAAKAISQYGVAPIGKSVSATPQSSSAASAIVVSKVTITNPDGSTTTIITYADGHTDTETTHAKATAAAASGPAQPAAAGATGNQGRVTAVNLLA